MVERKPFTSNLLTIGQVSEHCQVSEKTVRRWISRGDLIAHKLGHQWRVSSRDLGAFLALRRGQELAGYADQ